MHAITIYIYIYIYIYIHIHTQIHASINVYMRARKEYVSGPAPQVLTFMRRYTKQKCYACRWDRRGEDTPGFHVKDGLHSEKGKCF